jgi:hypothetical protein
MPKRRKKKQSKQYPVAGKSDLNSLPATPTRRAACKVVLDKVVSKIHSQLADEHEKRERLAKREREAREFNASVTAQLRKLAKRETLSSV